jgi:hypothetical protein
MRLNLKKKEIQRDDRFKFFGAITHYQNKYCPLTQYFENLKLFHELFQKTFLPERIYFVLADNHMI